MKKWIVPISLALALAACNDVSTVTPVAQSQSQQVKATAAAGVTVTAGDNGNWGTSFNGLITITNPNATATTWATLKVKLPAGSGITGAPWGASDAVTLDANGYYNFVPNGWSGQNIGANASITIGYNGTGGNSKATECYLDGSTVNLCGTTVVADTTAPTASLVASSTNVTAAGSVTFTATAADNVGVTKVEFYEGTTLLASKTAAPFTNSVSYTSANNGTKSYTVKAFDAAGNVTTSSAVSVVVNIATVVNPSVTLAASSTSVTTASTLTLTATPANITPSKVEFYSGTTLIATKTAAPYTHAIALTSANNGAKTFTAKVYSAASTTAAATSAAVNVNVNIATTPAITLAASSTSITTASTLTLTATPSNVTPSKVEFYSGTTLIKTVTAAPYTHAIALTSANNGAKTFTAKVYKSGTTAAVATSAAVNVNVNIVSSTTPAITLAASSTNVTTASTLTLTATPSNVTPSKVEFYSGTTLIATKTAAPYTHAIALTSANNGAKTFTAKVYKSGTTAAVATSAAVNVTVAIGVTNTDTTKPTVSLASSSTNVTAAGSITLTANASDNVGVAKVEFYRGATLISTDTSSPYSAGLNLTSADNGTLSLTAKAFDAAGNNTTSSAVSVVVNIGNVVTGDYTGDSVCYTGAMGIAAGDGNGKTSCENYFPAGHTAVFPQTADGKDAFQVPVGTPVTYRVNVSTDVKAVLFTDLAGTTLLFDTTAPFEYTTNAVAGRTIVKAKGLKGTDTGSEPAGSGWTYSIGGSVSGNQFSNRRIAYFGQWKVYSAAHHIADLDSADTNNMVSKLTHLQYAFGNISNDGTCFSIDKLEPGATDPNAAGAGTGGDAWADMGTTNGNNGTNGVLWSDTEYTENLRGNLNQLKQLKAKYPNLKVMISLGGWTWSKNFSSAASTDAGRKKLVSSCINYWIKGNLPYYDNNQRGGPRSAAGIFDGIDIDWEFPGGGGQPYNSVSASDGVYFTALMQEFRSQLDAYGSRVGRRFALTAAIGSGQSKIDANNPANYQQYMDYIGLMSYDFHGGWEKSTAHQAQLYPDPNGKFWDADGKPLVAQPVADQFSISNSVNKMLGYGVPANKVVVGVPFYGRGWTGVAAGTTNGLYQLASGTAAGIEPGYDNYNVIKNKAGTVYNNTAVGITWKYDGTTWWGYDDVQLMTQKTQYVKNNGLGGVLIWDTSGDSNTGDLMNAIHNNL